MLRRAHRALVGPAVEPVPGVPAHVLERHVRQPGRAARVAGDDERLEDVGVLRRLLGAGLPPAALMRIHPLRVGVDRVHRVGLDQQVLDVRVVADRVEHREQLADVVRAGRERTGGPAPVLADPRPARRAGIAHAGAVGGDDVPAHCSILPRDPRRCATTTKGPRLPRFAEAGALSVHPQGLEP